jgi:general secretion pathway protein K
VRRLLPTRPKPATGRRAVPFASRRGTRGAALLLVMYLVALLTALIGAFALTARMEQLQGRVLSQGVVADQLARAGLEYAMVRVADPEPSRQWLPDGRTYDWEFEGAQISVVIVDESGKIDLNGAAQPLLASLFQVLGAAPDMAAAVASAIVDWRDEDVLSQAQGGAEDPQYAAAGLPYGAKDAPFDTVGELEQVLGMSAELFALAAPHLTVFTGQAEPEQMFASAEVLQAMGIDPTPILQQRQAPAIPGQAPLVGSGSGTYSVASRARLRNGRESTLRVVVRAEASGLPGFAYTPLRWNEGVSPR